MKTRVKKKVGELAQLEICKCPTHGFWAVMLGRGGAATRLTHPKCCGSWTTIKAFDLDETDLTELARLAEDYADEVSR